ncbi:MAG: NYN domain-containing protein [Chloroflexota bacterium]
MPHIIDGHNLIPRIPGLSLQHADDEIELITLLQTYSRTHRKKVEAYFDRSPPGTPHVKHFGPVVAYFIPEGKTADDAIQARLHRLGKAARNWTVVSSDRAVQRAAHAAGAHVVSSETFACELTPKDPPTPTDDAPTEQEVTYWLRQFEAGSSSDQENEAH